MPFLQEPCKRRTVFILDAKTSPAAIQTTCMTEQPLPFSPLTWDSNIPFCDAEIADRGKALKDQP